jgi:hypothetical protein
MLKWVSLTKGWGNLYLHNFLTYQHVGLHTCQLHIFINYECHFGIFCSKSNGFVVQTCMLSRLLSIQFAFVIIGHDLYWLMFCVIISFK